MPNPQNRNDRRKGEDRSETLIIPHITKEMLETARRMAEEAGLRVAHKPDSQEICFVEDNDYAGFL